MGGPRCEPEADEVGRDPLVDDALLGHCSEIVVNVEDSGPSTDHLDRLPSRQQATRNIASRQLVEAKVDRLQEVPVLSWRQPSAGRWLPHAGYSDTLQHTVHGC